MRLAILRIRVLLIKELLQAVRDPRLRFLIILPPMFQLLAFGYAANLDLKHIPTALYDEDRSGTIGAQGPDQPARAENLVFFSFEVQEAPDQRDVPAARSRSGQGTHGARSHKSYRW